MNYDDLKKLHGGRPATGDLSVLHWAQVLARAAEIGGGDEGQRRPERTGEQIAGILLIRWRVGHARALRHAYMSGRFHRRLEIEGRTI